MSTESGGRPPRSHTTEEARRDAKPQWRRELRARRRERYGGEDGRARRAAEARKLLEHAELLLAEAARRAGEERAPRIAAFSPLGTEADVMPIVWALHAAGAEVLFPADADSPMLDWVLWDGGAFTASPGRGFGSEPTGRRLGPRALQAADLVLAPALAVDRTGTRIGHGGGYYDRALVDVPPERVIVIVHPSEVLEGAVLPRGPRDIPVARALTASGLERLGDSGV